MIMMTNEVWPLRRLNFVCYVLIGLFLAAYGQPARIPLIGLLAAVGAYALIWRGLYSLSSTKQRFWGAFLAFALIQSVQLSWMTSDHYHGFYIFLVYFVLLAALGAQFGLTTLFLMRGELTLYRLLAGASLWTLMEWLRLFVLSGFSWNPVGLALTVTDVTRQFVSLGGVYGLSFWVMLVNLLLLYAWRSPYKVKRWCYVGVLALLPFVFGCCHLSYHSEKLAEQAKVSSFKVSLVQTALSAEEKLGFGGRVQGFIPPFQQWERILALLMIEGKYDSDLIVLPEGTVPFEEARMIYSVMDVQAAFHAHFPEKSLVYFPPLERPFAAQDRTGQWLASNAYWAQSISNLFHSTLIAGFDSSGLTEDDESYNAAFFFQPGCHTVMRYEKRVLVPMGEYIPFDWCRDLAAKYGIYGSFIPGDTAKVFPASSPLGMSICYEETYGHLMRENRQCGAEVLVNITNDVWFPNSTLPKQHSDLAILRSIENGIPLVRAANTGVTLAVDSLGRNIATLNPEGESCAGVLNVEVPKYYYDTLYTQLGDSLIIGFCLLMLILFLRL